MLRTETYIFKKIQEGSLKEFERVFRDFYPLLCQYALRFVKDIDQSEEIVQELFYQLWKQRKQLEIHTSLKAYLYRATYHNCLHFMRQKAQANKYEDYIRRQVKKEDTPAEVLNEKEMYGIIEDTLETLPQRCSKIFRMNRFEGLRYKEIADKLSISVKTVEANMGKALKALRKNLKDYAGLFLF